MLPFFALFSILIKSYAQDMHRGGYLVCPSQACIQTLFRHVQGCHECPKITNQQKDNILVSCSTIKSNSMYLQKILKKVTIKGP